MADAGSARTPDDGPSLPELREDPGLYAILRILRRRWLAVVGCMIAVPAIALALSLGQTREYTASASLLFPTRDLTPGNVQNTPLPPSTDPTREANTNLTLAELQTVAQGTADALRGGLTGEASAREVW